MSELLSCTEFVELVTDYLEDRLPPETRQRFDAHISTCQGCAAYFQQMRQTIALTGKLTETDIDHMALQTLLDAFRHWKQENIS